MQTSTDTPSVAMPRPSSHRPGWLRGYQATLVALDGILIAGAVTASVALRRTTRGADLKGVSYYVVAALVGLIWWASLALTRSYESRYLAEGPEEFRRVARAGVRVAAVLGVLCFVADLPLSRGFLGTVLPLALVSLLVGRGLARRVLRSRRRSGRWNHRVVAVGDSARVEEMVGELVQNPAAGLEVVATVLLDDEHHDLEAVAAMVRGAKADTVAVAPWPGMSGDSLRDLTYAVERSQVDMLVAPSLVDVSGSRLSIRAVAGIPLLQLREVELAGPARVFKTVSDRFWASLAIVLLSPVLLLVAVLVRLSGSGPLLVKTRSVGFAGAHFDQLSFRVRLPEPPWDGVDRRGQVRPKQPFTRIGKLLEKAKLDDLPKLWNIVRGDMAVVGPRPLKAGRRSNDPVEQRRLLVRPGLTGLAQVSGRGRLPEDEEGRLDQQYVDNWSPTVDLLIVLKTAGMVLRGRRLT